MDISSESDDKKNNLVSFDGKKDPCGRFADALVHSRLNRNIALVTQKRKQLVFSSESFETEYSSECQTSMMVCSPEDVGTCQFALSANTGHHEVIILNLDSDGNDNVDNYLVNGSSVIAL